MASTQPTESDKALAAFEALNTSLEAYILITADGVPFKYNENSLTRQEAVKYAGLIYDLILFSKKTLDDFKKTPNYGYITLRMRLKNGKEIIVVQEGEYYLISIQVCKITPELQQLQEKEAEKKP